MAISKHSCNGYWRDRMGYKRNGITLSGVADFALAQAFLTAMKAYSNLALMRVVQSTTTQERVSGETPTEGHFDLGGYIARLSFYNYAAEDAGDSPSTTLVIPAPKDSIITENKEGIWLVNEDVGQAIAGHMATALGLGSNDIEFISGEVPEN